MELRTSMEYAVLSKSKHCKIGFICPKFYSGRENGKKVLTISEHCVLTSLEEIVSLLHFETLFNLILKVAFALDYILKGDIFKCHNLTEVHERGII